MAGTTEIMSAIADMRKENKADIARLDDKIKAVSAQRHTGARPDLRHRPHESGADLMGSNGFSFTKLIQALHDSSYSPQAAVELDYCNKLADIARKDFGQCWSPWRETARHRALAPLWPQGFATPGEEPTKMAYEMKSMLNAAVEGYDPEEAMWHQQKVAPAAGAPAMSATDVTTGGAFVPPPSFGEPIELLRNEEVMLKAGASIVSLGPSGSIIFPRLLQATSAGMVPENTAQQPVNPGTGQLLLKNKKVMSVVILPGELMRFGGPTVEQMVRRDIMKSIALKADKEYLEGPGSDTQILGLATMGANGQLVTITPTTANQLAPQDCYAFLSAIEENNGKATCWIMRPKMKYAFAQSRWTPYSTGTNQGGFVFEYQRPFDSNPMAEPNPYLAGVKLVASAQVSNTRGTGGNQTYVLAGWAQDYYVALFGAIEMMTTDQGLNLASSDQILIRAILTTDGGPRHPSTWSFADSLSFTVAP